MLLNPTTRKIIISNEVVFIEDNFDLNKLLHSKEKVKTVDENNPIPVVKGQELQEQIQVTVPPVEEIQKAPIEDQDLIEDEIQNSFEIETQNSAEDEVENLPQNEIPIENQTEQMIEPRFTEPPEILDHSMVTQGKAGIVKRNPKYALQVSANTPTPSSFAEASRDTQWKEAMDKEISALHKNDTWILVPPE